MTERYGLTFWGWTIYPSIDMLVSLKRATLPMPGRILCGNKVSTRNWNWRTYFSPENIVYKTKNNNNNWKLKKKNISFDFGKPIDARRSFRFPEKFVQSFALRDFLRFVVGVSVGVVDALLFSVDDDVVLRWRLVTSLRSAIVAVVASVLGWSVVNGEKLFIPSSRTKKARAFLAWSNISRKARSLP